MQINNVMARAAGGGGGWGRGDIHVVGLSGGDALALPDDVILGAAGGVDRAAAGVLLGLLCRALHACGRVGHRHHDRRLVPAALVHRLQHLLREDRPRPSEPNQHCTQCAASYQPSWQPIECNCTMRLNSTRVLYPRMHMCRDGQGVYAGCTTYINVYTEVFNVYGYTHILNDTRIMRIMGVYECPNIQFCPTLHMRINMHARAPSDAQVWKKEQQN